MKPESSVKILISAAETSSDAHGAKLLEALRYELRDESPVHAFGIGGPLLQAAGLKALVDTKDLMVMGSTEVLGRLPRILKALDEITSLASRELPDVAVVIDYPDFHFRLARRLKKLNIPLVYYIPPKVWVWRKGRVRLLARLFDRILCIFPFEEEFYRKAGVSVKYVGNPLVDELPLRLTRSEAREKLQLNLADKVVVMMPGSRPSELKKHVEPMLQAAVIATARLRSTGWLKGQEKLKILMPLPLTANLDRFKNLILDLNSKSVLDIRVSQGDSALSLIAADAGLIKSGTSTLEAGILGCPHAVVYKPSWMTAQIFKRLVRYRGPVGLVNLVEGWKKGDPMVAHEILMENVTAENLAKELISLLSDPDRREVMARRFQSLREKLGAHQLGGSPSAVAAREILEVVKKCRGS